MQANRQRAKWLPRFEMLTCPDAPRLPGQAVQLALVGSSEVENSVWCPWNSAFGLDGRIDSDKLTLGIQHGRSRIPAIQGDRNLDQISVDVKLSIRVLRRCREGLELTLRFVILGLRTSEATQGLKSSSRVLTLHQGI
jgi:hypothetical protein